jgi:iron(III) transport system ATP-binding protein
MNFLQVSQISLQEAGNYVLQNISFTQQEYQKIAIAGETGSGKSTLLQTIAGLVQPSTGQVWFGERKVKGPQDQLVPGHPGIAYLSQQFELPRFLRVEQILTYANQLPAADAASLYEVCRIHHLLHRRTDHLSGGERQRIALARLLLSAPRLLLLDEPYSNLDIGHKNILKAVIRDIGEILDLTCILISHDPLDTLSWADEILVIKQGQIRQQGTPPQIYRQPIDEYTAALFGSYNLIPVGGTSIFAPLTGNQPDGKSLLIRPENIKIIPSSEQTPALAGEVRKATFFGSYLELEVLVSGLTLTVRTDASSKGGGDMVDVAVSPEDVWYI